MQIWIIATIYNFALLHNQKYPQNMVSKPLKYISYFTLVLTITIFEQRELEKLQ